jgi:hypothetical protein
MSTLKANTIVASDGSSPVTLTKQQAARAWCAFSPASASVVDSLNSSGITDNGTGDFTISYTNSFNTAEGYTAGGQVAHSSATTTSYCCQPYSDSTVATGSTRYSILYNTASAVGVADYNYAATTNHGDLA